MTGRDGNNQMVEQSREEAYARREQDTKLGMSMLGKVALAVVIVVSLIISISCVMRFNRLEEEKDRLAEQLEENNEKMAEIQYWINHTVDDEYIEKFAKEKGWDFATAKEYLVGKN